MIDTILEILEEIWEFLAGIGEGVGDILEAFGGDVLGNVWFWVFYMCLLAGVWVLPSKFGVLDYKLWEKIMYTFIFFFVDYFVISKFID